MASDPTQRRDEEQLDLRSDKAFCKELMTAAATCRHQTIHVPSHSDELTDFGALLAVSVSVDLKLSRQGSSLFVICFIR